MLSYHYQDETADVISQHSDAVSSDSQTDCPSASTVRKEPQLKRHDNKRQHCTDDHEVSTVSNEFVFDLFLNEVHVSPCHALLQFQTFAYCLQDESDDDLAGVSRHSDSARSDSRSFTPLRKRFCGAISANEVCHLSLNILSAWNGITFK